MRPFSYNIPLIIVLTLGTCLLATWPASYNIDKLASQTRPQTLSAPARLVLGLKVPAREATATDLVHLPGLGKVKAQALVDFLKDQGPLYGFDALLEVPGIGPKTLAKIKPYLSL